MPSNKNEISLKFSDKVQNGIYHRLTKHPLSIWTTERLRDWTLSKLIALISTIAQSKIFGVDALLHRSMAHVVFSHYTFILPLRTLSFVYVWILAPVNSILGDMDRDILYRSLDDIKFIKDATYSTPFITKLSKNVINYRFLTVFDETVSPVFMYLPFQRNSQFSTQFKAEVACEFFVFWILSLIFATEIPVKTCLPWGLIQIQTTSLGRVHSYILTLREVSKFGIYILCSILDDGEVISMFGAGTFNTFHKWQWRNLRSRSSVFQFFFRFCLY